MKLFVGMPSTSMRREVRAETLANVANVLGAQVHVETNLDTEPIAYKSQRLVCDRLINAARDEGASHILILEDDIILHRRLPERLEQCLRLNSVVTLYLPGEQFYPYRTRWALWFYQPIVEQITPIAALDQWWGSQALILPIEIALAERMERQPLWDADSYDYAIRHYCLWHDIPIYAHIPSLVQHRDGPGTVNLRSSHRSITFDYPHVERGSNRQTPEILPNWTPYSHFELIR